MSPSAQRLVERYYDLQAISSAIGLLNWDRQVLMPPGGAAARTAQVGRLTRMHHEMLVSDELRRLLEDAAAGAEPESDDAALVRVLRRDLDVETKLPLEHVERKARVSSEAYEVWKTAKANSDFPMLRPYLEQLFDLAREKSELIGYEDHIYDPLIDLFEEGAKQADAARMFQEIKKPIVDLVREIRESGTPNDDSILIGDWDQPRLRRFAQETAAAIGFDFNRGRLDIAPNAFCGGVTSQDVRMTTRPSEHIKGIVSSSLHEMGHGLYEQGSPAEWDRSPLAGGTSLAVHESQSRLWENIVGRSQPFWEFFFPRLAAEFSILQSSNPQSFYRMMNKVEPTFVRVGSDELTYNLHILVRFELECEILTGQTAVKHLPEAWNAKYTEYLGITPRNDSEGCLQDVHWSRGSIGYFPTYAMGNLIGGQIWAVLNREIGDVAEQVRRGQFGDILNWLRAKIYAQSKRLSGRELVTRVTGRPMEAADWLQYAQSKYRAIYSLPR
ncbi:MAG TPA: carboxypeptidase M32 [Fimbriimonadaceae bacterium]|nr:carboxypeptidase M32 [Fimbriimonadaceae bacterium]